MSRDALKRALRTAVQTFVGVFGIQLLGWINDVAEWTSDTDRVFPQTGPLVKAGIAAAAAAGAGLVSYVMNAIEDATSNTGKGVLGAVKPEAHGGP